MIDVVTGRRLRRQTVLIAGDRIVGVGRLPVPRGTTVIDATGKYVVPGLVDMHVHSLGDEHVSPPLYLATGVTTVREMAGVDPALYDWRDRIEAGTLLGPRMVVASRIIDGDPTLWDPTLMQALVVDTPGEARAAVRRVHADGADFVKVYSRLNKVAYLAIIDEARKLGLTVHGHGPDNITTQDVSNAGQRSIEHTHSVSLSVSTHEAAVRRMLREMNVPTGDYNGPGASISPGSCSRTTSRSWPAPTPVRRTRCPGSRCTTSSNNSSRPAPLHARPCTPPLPSLRGSSDSAGSSAPWRPARSRISSCSTPTR